MKIKKILIIVAASVLMTALLAGGVYAAYTLMHGTSNTVKNDFAADVDNTPSVDETFDGAEKSAVKVTIPDDVDYSVYVRATVVVNWQKTENGETFVYPAAPVAGTDYSITYGTSGWFEKDGFYYYENPVVGGGETAVLISSCSSKGTEPEGYTLHVEVLTQTVQAAGTTDNGDIPAVEDAWGVVTVDSTGKLVEKTSG